MLALRQAAENDYSFHLVAARKPHEADTRRKSNWRRLDLKGLLRFHIGQCNERDQQARQQERGSWLYLRFFCCSCWERPSDRLSTTRDPSSSLNPNP